MGDCNLLMGYVNNSCFNVLLGLPYHVVVWQYSHITVSANLNVLLHKDFPQSPHTSGSSTTSCPTRAMEPSKSAELSPVQKGSVQGAVAAVDISVLLSTTWYSGSFVG